MVEILCTFDAVPWAFFVFQRKEAHVAGIEHNPDVALYVGILPAIPVFGVNVGVGVRR